MYSGCNDKFKNICIGKYIRMFESNDYICMGHYDIFIMIDYNEFLFIFWVYIFNAFREIEIRIVG